MPDKIKCLKIESPLLGGTESDPYPTETNPAQDYLAAKGIAFENLDNTVIESVAGQMRFKDSEVLTSATLRDMTLRLALKNVDISLLTDGFVLTWNNTLQKFELRTPGGSGSGVTPPFFFSRSGATLAIGTYFFTGNVATNSTGQLIAGTNTIIKIAASTSANITGTPCVIQFQRRTAVATFSDITGGSISIPVGTFKATATVAIPVGPDIEISCYFKSGGSPSNPVVGIYLVPA